MSRYFVQNGSYAYAELPVKEINTGKTFTLTQPKTLFNEDYYVITRFIAVENVPVDVVPEPYFYVYKASWMEPGTSLITKFVSEDVMIDFMRDFPKHLLHGNACSYIQKYFEGK